jgi:Protein of unknown function (DUF3040)
MRLRPHEQRVLDQIERALRACDPKLVGMLSTFTRLTAHERMPSEDDHVAGSAARDSAAQRAAASRPGIMSPQATMSRNSLLKFVSVMAAAAVLFVSLLVLIGTGGSHRTSSGVCPAGWAPMLACSATSPAKSAKRPASRSAAPSKSSTSGITAAVIP